MQKHASALWSQMEADKQHIMDRTERLAALTIPKICRPEHLDKDVEMSHDYQSIGAQAVNHVTNKLMLAMFAPSRPFFRLGLSGETKAKALAAGVKLEELAPAFSQAERDAVAELDSRAQRPKLYQSCRHLVVAGNVLVVLEEDHIRVMGLRYWCVKRDYRGRVQRLIIREKLCFEELDPKVQQALPLRYQPESTVSHYKLIQRNPNGDYRMEQWVDDTRLPSVFDGRWPEAKCPYRVLAWDLGDEDDYGTGLVEDYMGDLEAVSVMAESVVDGGVLGCEIRYLVNPAGVTSADDFNKSENGDAVSGRPEDIDAITPGNAEAVKVAMTVAEGYEQRIARGFLLGSALTRNAERVTAEEIRQTALELEQSFGGVYSALAAQMQAPIAYWCMGSSGVKIAGLKDITVTVLTGLDALSRTADIDNLKLALTDLSLATQLPEPLQVRINWQSLESAVLAGRGVTTGSILITEEQYQKQQQAQQAARVNEQAAVEGAKTPTQ